MQFSNFRKHSVFPPTPNTSAENSKDYSSINLPNILGYLKEVNQNAVHGKLEGYDAYYFNVQHFSRVNDEFGYEEGTTILSRYANTLQNFIASDEVLGRLGGDNFVALIRCGERSSQFRDLLRGIPVEAHCQNGDIKQITIKSVAGIMEVTRDCSIDDIISGPATAYDYAKRNNRDSVYLNGDIFEDTNHSRLIEESFEHALNNEEFSVYYQPKVNSISGKIIGCEALSRWLYNDEVVSPRSFVPFLEQTGKIIGLDLMVLEIVCQDLAQWKAKGYETVPVSVNFSRRDLTNPELAKTIIETIEKYGVDKKDVIVEVTESASEEKYEQMANFLNDLKNFGIVSSIDDFGTGYSSLSVLREFPVNEIKIDRSFINRNLDENDKIIIQSIIDMAHKLGIEVITEGVESNEQKEFLHELGCDRIQGFLYDKPLPREEFEKRLLEDGYKL